MDDYTGVSPLVYGFGTYDPSDARGNPDRDSLTGSGVGSAPSPGDGRFNQDINPPLDNSEDLGADYARISPLLADNDTWPDDPSDTRQNPDNDAPHGSGAALGSPEFEYDPLRQLGYLVEDMSPIDGGLNDPIRDGNTPTRRAVTRFLFTREKWAYWTPADFGRSRALIGSAFRGAQQPPGRMNPMDEYRLLSDGTHA